ncbi:hypothetical protein JTE90_026110 [Oedothorax gibbosus]|uniref:Uncharacterized protein n=1 Tax=Oedothorax gibbosus TaxID=931172 RepID=A0AAV6TN88_9ARAC|nr:hypothetical protein JTE90_026110 [Oedothorax gibbosus]
MLCLLECPGWVQRASPVVACSFEDLGRSVGDERQRPHGTMTVGHLAKVMQDLFGEVSYVAIDVDSYQYPTGSGRVTFRYNRSYAIAVTNAFILICTGRFKKKVQIQPYLEKDGGACESCGRPNAFQFCRSCLRNFCCDERLPPTRRRRQPC